MTRHVLLTVWADGHRCTCAGYWPSDFYKANPAFGSKEDLLDLIKAYQTNGEQQQQQLVSVRSHAADVTPEPVAMLGHSAAGAPVSAPGWCMCVWPALSSRGVRSMRVRRLHEPRCCPAAAAADIYVMFDQVVNHVGYGDFSSYHPFNETTDFHNCDGA